MWWMLAFFICATSLCLCVFLLARVTRLFLSMQDRIEESLDIMDECYVELGKILEKPVFFDSLEVRQVVTSIEKVHASIIYIANGVSLNRDDVQGTG